MKKLMSGLIGVAMVLGAGSEASMAQETSSNLGSAKSRTQQLMGDIAPKLAELTDDVLYADIWERPQLSQRDRSLVTVSALIALNRPDQLRSHLVRAKANGLTEEQLVETITHMAFYSGWPSAVSAIAIAKDVFAEN
jgi:4-carboxymuconolactone decarboxylase